MNYNADAGGEALLEFARFSGLIKSVIVERMLISLNSTIDRIYTTTRKLVVVGNDKTQVVGVVI